jgi:hypothetical protein
VLVAVETQLLIAPTTGNNGQREKVEATMGIVIQKKCYPTRICAASKPFPPPRSKQQQQKVAAP